MDKKVSILHLITAAKNASPFDVNMAYDAGFENVVPYTNVALAEVKGLVQDAIFSRGTAGLQREGIFIGGRDIDVAMDMLAAAQSAMVPPFVTSVFADPSGAFTTAAAMMAKVEQQLRLRGGAELAGHKISIFGATGPVGGCAAVIAARYGAEVEMVAHQTMHDVEMKAATYNQRYGVRIACTDGSSEDLKAVLLANTDIVLCCAAAGVRVITLAQLTAAKRLKVVADVNAVPPTGVEGVDVHADGAAIAGTAAIGIGALTIGDVKYRTQHNLLKAMLAGGSVHYFDFLSAFEIARSSL